MLLHNMKLLNKFYDATGQQDWQGMFLAHRLPHLSLHIPGWTHQARQWSDEAHQNRNNKCRMISFLMRSGQMRLWAPLCYQFLPHDLYLSRIKFKKPKRSLLTANCMGNLKEQLASDHMINHVRCSKEIKVHLSNRSTKGTGEQQGFKLSFE